MLSKEIDNNDVKSSSLSSSSSSSSFNYTMGYLIKHNYYHKDSL